MSLEPPLVDVEAGLLRYSTGGGRHIGTLRANFSDFQVEELINLEGLVQERSQGLVPVYKVEKAGEDTPHVAREIASAIKSEVSFAGLKDKNATVVQFVSAKSSRALAPSEVRGPRFEAKLVGFSRPVTRGMLVGNRFKIRVETDEEFDEEVDACLAACRERRVANFFGYQRFGLRGGANRRVGKAIVSRDFASATRSLLARPREGEGEDAQEARRLCSEGRYRDALERFSPRQDIERKVAGHLAQKPDDHIGALRRIPIPIRRLLVNAYQAYLFNLALSRALGEGLELSRALPGDNWAELKTDGLALGKVHGVKEAPSGTAIPLLQIVGYAYRNYGSRFDSALAEVIKEEGVSPGSFYVKEAEEISNEGGFRAAPILAADLASSRAGSGYLLEFSLGKGEYATVLLRELLKPEAPGDSGF